MIIPTFNERKNIRPLLEKLEAALADIAWEVIFVDDDSPDGTAETVRDIAQRNPRVRLIQRIGRRGLASACVEGVLASSAPYFAVIDADMQHDEALLPRMLARLRDDELDIVVGSRYVEEGGVDGWSRRRRFISRLASLAARRVMKGDVKDPMSGFFVMRRQAFDRAEPHLSQHGFKILLDLFASSHPPLRFAELPYRFRMRTYGHSKLDSMVVWDYGMLLADKMFGRFMPPRFLLFGLVGGLGLAIHLLTLGVALRIGLAFAVSQAIAVIVAMTSNFALNNLITYSDRRLTGWGFVAGMSSFWAVCSVGAVANVGVAVFLYSELPIWWLAGLGGALVGSVWNYAVSGFFTWRNR